MIDFRRGRYHAFTALTDADIRRAQKLRGQCFAVASGHDADAFDDAQHHILVRDLRSDTLVCCFRLRLLRGPDLGQSYAAQFYGLEALAFFDGLMMELGRFCVLPDANDPEIVRTAWAALTTVVEAQNIKLLFGCSSFAGTKAQAYEHAFAVLTARHLAPHCWRPSVKAHDIVRFAERIMPAPDLKKAMLHMPPLLRTYLLMGGWVSDHAVIDRQMNTLHVFTGLEIGRIPESRRRLLRGLV